MLFRSMFIDGERVNNSSMVAMETKKDSMLSKVLYFTRNGWSVKPRPEFFPYFSKRFELSYEDVLIWDSRVPVVITDSFSCHTP